METKRRLGQVMKRGVLTAMLAGVIVTGLAACGGDTAAPAANTPSTGSTATTGSTGDTGNVAAVQEMKVALNEWTIAPKNVEVNSGKVRFLVTNDGQFPHNLAVVVDGTNERTPNFKKDEGVKTLELDMKPGTYKLVCDITGHEERGMVGELVVK